MKAPHTHALWWRVVHAGTREPLTAWHDAPRLYRSAKAVDMAARDFPKHWFGRCEVRVLPVGERPQD
jgi:hypothetical protein